MLITERQHPYEEDVLGVFTHSTELVAYRYAHEEFPKGIYISFN